MKKFFYKFLAKLFRKNFKATPTAVILDQLLEPRPLPLGVQEFEEWSDRIIAGAVIPGADPRSQKFALSDALLHLGPQESHKPDAYFIHSLRKFAVNQVAIHVREALKEQQKRELAARANTPEGQEGA